MDWLRKIIKERRPGPWFATCFEFDKDSHEEATENEAWTVGPCQDDVNWTNDANYHGYGLPLPDAKFIAFFGTTADLWLELFEAAEQLDDLYPYEIDRKLDAANDRLRAATDALVAAKPKDV